MPSRIPFIRPSLPSAQLLSEDIASMVESNWFSNFGPFERDFRSAISEYVGNDVTAVTLNNATTGLMAALAACMPRGEQGSEIAVASFTFAAAAHAVTWHGYSPAWIDIDEDTLQPSLNSMLDLQDQNKNIRAIILTNTFGIANEEIHSWEEYAAEFRIPLIIDSAAGFGSQYANGERMGSRGDCEVFSFHATKPFAIGEGGALFTKNENLADAARRFTNFGFGPESGAHGIGLNGKMQEINAAIGLRQLDSFESNLARRRQVLNAYLDAFEFLPLRFPAGIESSSLCFATIVLDNSDQVSRCLDALGSAEVDARTYYSPSVHLQPWFERYQPRVALAATESIAGRVISLPILADMTATEIDRVSSAVRSALSH